MIRVFITVGILTLANPAQAHEGLVSESTVHIVLHAAGPFVMIVAGALSIAAFAARRKKGRVSSTFVAGL